MHTEPFQSALIRFCSLGVGLICLAFAVRCVQKQSVWWRFPFYSDIRRQEQPLLYWFAVGMLFVFSAIACLAAIFNVKRVSFTI
jgi:hypothetical protein